MKHHSTHVDKHHKIYTICIIGFLLTLHVTLPSYINSSFLNVFSSEQTVGLLYTISSIVIIIGFLSIHHLLRKIGNYKTTMLLATLQLFTLFGIVFSNSFPVIATCIIAMITFGNLMGYTMDIFLESDTDTHHTGSIRGIYMTVINISWLIAPLVSGALITDGGEGFHTVYLAAVFLLVPVMYLISKNYEHHVDSNYSHMSARVSLNKVFANKSLRNLFLANITLNTFYAWMIVFTPIYLNKYLGYGWDDIGIIFTFMLLPFVLIEYPLGKIADKKWGEKELMTIGFIILGISTIALTWLSNGSIIWWGILLFITRIGAAMAEIMIETYFFKKVPENQVNMLSIFRITRPISYFIAPAITSIGLIFMPHSKLFIILGIFCLFGAYWSSRIRDTN